MLLYYLAEYSTHILVPFFQSNIFLQLSVGAFCSIFENQQKQLIKISSEMLTLFEKLYFGLSIVSNVQYYFLLESKIKQILIYNIFTFLALLQTLHTYFTLQYKKKHADRWPF